MSIKFVENDSEKIISELVKGFENALGETLQPSDERRIFLSQLAQVIVGINSNINDTGNQVILRYARGESLDAIGELLGVERLQAECAKCTLKFTISAPQETSITIPKGTRATPDGIIYFLTEKDLIILAGEVTGEVSAIAGEAGEAYNDFTSGQIKYIVDNTTFLASVENTTVSAGGTDGESDDSFRERIRLVPESFSTTGCEEGYIYYAKSASADVGDVVPYSPVNDESLTEEERMAGAGKVFIYILKADGSIPSEDDELIKIVYNSVSALDKRPLTDFVTVLPPSAVEYSINLEYYISQEDEINAVEIQEKVSAAIEQYIKWQSEKIGRDINPDKLRNLMLNAGASRIVITTPSFTTLNKTQIASLNGAITADFSGFSE